MSETVVTLRNVSPWGDLEIPVLGRVVAAGEEFEVPSDIAGHEPSDFREPDENEEFDVSISRVSDEGVIEIYDPGVGLLAQTANFKRVKKQHSAAKTEAVTTAESPKE